MKIIVAFLFLFASAANAYQINDVQVIRYGERYVITFDATMDAPMDGLIRVIGNFEKATTLTPAVKSTEVLRYDDNTMRVTVVMRPCVYIFCRTLTKLSVARINEDSIQLFGVEDAGSFTYSRESLKFEPLQTGTRMRYKGDISPKIFLPQWLGVRFIHGAIRKYMDGILTEIETQAKTGA